MVVFETHHTKKYAIGYGVAPQTRISLHTMGLNRCFWIPKMVVFETHNSKTYAIGSRVAPQTRIPLHTVGQKRCLRIPKMVVLETYGWEKQRNWGIRELGMS